MKHFFDPDENYPDCFEPDYPADAPAPLMSFSPESGFETRSPVPPSITERQTVQQPHQRTRIKVAYHISNHPMCMPEFGRIRGSRLRTLH